MKFEDIDTLAGTIDPKDRDYPDIDKINKIAIVGLGLVGSYVYQSIIDHVETTGAKIDLSIHTKMPFNIDQKFPGAVFVRFVPGSVSKLLKSFEVHQYYDGTDLGYYSELLWGERVKTSIDNLDKDHVRKMSGYDPSEVYYQFVKGIYHETLYFDRINSRDDLEKLCEDNDLVIQTIPDFMAPIPDGRFNFVVEVDTIAVGRKNTIVYNATGVRDKNIMCGGCPGVAKGWVRESVLFERVWIECVDYPLVRSSGKVRRLLKLSPSVKPNFRGVKPNILKVGRWSTLRKYELAHQAYFDVTHFLKERVK